MKKTYIALRRAVDMSVGGPVEEPHLESESQQVTTGTDSVSIG